MNKKWTILFCDPDFKPCPASEFLSSCTPAHQIKVIHFLELLEETGPTLPRPYADILREGIHELRIKLSGDQARLLYFFCFETFIVLYQALKKHESAVPEHFILDTLRYRHDLLGRMDREALEKHTKFRTYLHLKCSSPVFREQYDRICTVCATTAAVIGRIHDKGLSMEDMEQRTGIPVEDLKKLESADRCSPDDVQKLCSILDIRNPAKCPIRSHETF